jgi:hypothetical protein
MDATNEPKIEDGNAKRQNRDRGIEVNCQDRGIRAQKCHLHPTLIIQAEIKLPRLDPAFKATI